MPQGNSFHDVNRRQASLTLHSEFSDPRISSYEAQFSNRRGPAFEHRIRARIHGLQRVCSIICVMTTENDRHHDGRCPSAFGSEIYVVDRTRSATGGPCAIMRTVLGIDLSIYDWSTTGLRKKGQVNTIHLSILLTGPTGPGQRTLKSWSGYIPTRCWGWNDLCL